MSSFPPKTRPATDTHLEDEMEFILDGGSREERSARGHLVENAANPPHINGGGILGGAQEHVRRSVPKGHNLIAVGLGGNRLSSSQPKVRQLKIEEYFSFYLSSPTPGITTGIILFLHEFEKKKKPIHLFNAKLKKSGALILLFRICSNQQDGVERYCSIVLVVV